MVVGSTPLGVEVQWRTQMKLMRNQNTYKEGYADLNGIGQGSVVNTEYRIV